MSYQLRHCMLCGGEYHRTNDGLRCTCCGMIETVRTGDGMSTPPKWLFCIGKDEYIEHSECNNKCGITWCVYHCIEKEDLAKNPPEHISIIPLARIKGEKK
jgi:hypothetical protein